MSYITINEETSEKKVVVDFDNIESVTLYDTSDADVKPENLDDGVIAYGKSGKIIGTKKTS